MPQDNLAFSPCSSSQMSSEYPSGSTSQHELIMEAPDASFGCINLTISQSSDLSLLTGASPRRAFFPQDVGIHRDDEHTIGWLQSNGYPPFAQLSDSIPEEDIQSMAPRSSSIFRPGYPQNFTTDPGLIGFQGITSDAEPSIHNDHHERLPSSADSLLIQNASFIEDCETSPLRPLDPRTNVPGPSTGDKCPKRPLRGSKSSKQMKNSRPLARQAETFVAGATAPRPEPSHKRTRTLKSQRVTTSAQPNSVQTKDGTRSESHTETDAQSCKKPSSKRTQGCDPTSETTRSKRRRVRRELGSLANKESLNAQPVKAGPDEHPAPKHLEIKGTLQKSQKCENRLPEAAFRSRTRTRTSSRTRTLSPSSITMPDSSSPKSNAENILTRVTETSGTCDSTAGKSSARCWTCRLRRKRCDGRKPACEACGARNLTCDGYSNEPPSFMTDSKARSARLTELKRCSRRVPNI